MYNIYIYIQIYTYMGLTHVQTYVEFLKDPLMTISGFLESC